MTSDARPERDCPTRATRFGTVPRWLSLLAVRLALLVAAFASITAVAPPAHAQATQCAFSLAATAGSPTYDTQALACHIDDRTTVYVTFDNVTGGTRNDGPDGVPGTLDDYVQTAKGTVYYGNGSAAPSNGTNPAYSIYYLPAANASGSDTFTIRTVDDAGRDTVATYTVAITALVAPAITTSPSSRTVTAGATASFTAAASGNPTPSVQWQVSTDGGATFAKVVGATSTTYSFTAAAGGNGNQYRAVFTNSVGSATTTAATLTVNTVPAVTANPSSRTVAAGSTASFTAAASGSPTPGVQWQVSTDGGATFANVAGATSTTYSFTAAAGGNGNQYRAVFTNSAGSATTAAAKLSVTALTITPATLPDGAVGTAYSQTLTASGGTAPYSYAITAGALPDGLALDPATGTIAGTPTDQNSYSFTVTATDSAGPAASTSRSYAITIAVPAGGLTRTWVSGTGDDGNSCTRTAPCLTFGGAFQKTATGGEINCLDEGGFGTLTITRSVSIICTGRNARGRILATSESAITIDAPANASVVLSGIDVQGFGGTAGTSGVRFVAGGSLVIRDAQFRGFEGGYGIDFEPANSAVLQLDRVSIIDSGAAAGGSAILVRPVGGAVAQALITHSTAANNPQSGIRLETTSGSTGQVNATIANTILSGNGAAGLISRGAGGAIRATLTNGTISENGFGIIGNGATTVTSVANTTVTRNGTGLLTIGSASTLSSGGNAVAGNTTDGNFSGSTPRQ